MCPIANILILLYSIKRFLEVSVSLFLPVQRDEISFLTHRSQSESQRPLMPVHISATGWFPLITSFPQQEDWVVSGWNSPSSSNDFLVCARSPPLTTLCTVSRESWLTRQGRYVRNFGLNASSPNQLPKVSDWCHMMNALSWLHWPWREPGHLVEVLWTLLWGPDAHLPCAAKAKSGSEQGGVNVAHSGQEVSKYYVHS